MPSTYRRPQSNFRRAEENCATRLDDKFMAADPAISRKPSACGVPKLPFIVAVKGAKKYS
jgi:hypothetical protein